MVELNKQLNVSRRSNTSFLRGSLSLSKPPLLLARRVLSVVTVNHPAESGDWLNNFRKAF